jgi:hypothetical protein
MVCRALRYVTESLAARSRTIFAVNARTASFSACTRSQPASAARLYVGDDWGKVSRPRVGACLDGLAAGLASLHGQNRAAGKISIHLRKISGLSRAMPSPVLPKIHPLELLGK